MKGVVLDKLTKKSLSGTKIYLNSKTNDSLSLSTITDSEGKFCFKNIGLGNYTLSCFYIMTGERTNFKPLKADLGRRDCDSFYITKNGQGYNHTFYLNVSCPYDKTKNQNYCPKCKKKDKIQIISWGLSIPDLDSVNVLDNTYLGGCSQDTWCNPSKHCKRCNLDF